MRSGPLPSPEELAQYERILPGAPRLIFERAEREMVARHKLEADAQAADIQYRADTLRAQETLQRRIFASDMAGQLIGGLIAAGALVGAVYTAVSGVFWMVPVALVSLPIASIINAVRAVSQKKKP